METVGIRNETVAISGPTQYTQNLLYQLSSFVCWRACSGYNAHSMKTRAYTLSVTVSSLVVLATLFGVRVALSRQNAKPKIPYVKPETQSVSTIGGLLTLTYTGPADNSPPGNFTVRLAGKPIHTFKEVRYVSVYSSNSRDYMGDTVLLRVSGGKDSCPTMFHVVHIKTPTEYYVTKEFGDCSNIPSVTVGRDEMEVKFTDPPTTYVYADKGKITRLPVAKNK